MRLTTSRRPLKQDRHWSCVNVFISCALILCVMGGPLAFIGCQAQSTKGEISLGSTDELRALLKSLQEQATAHPEQVKRRLETLIPKWKDARSLLRAPTRWDAALTQPFEEMRSSALREIPWAFSAALEAEMTLVHVHKVSFNTGSDNAPGDLSLLKHLDLSPIYNITLRHPKGERGLRLGGWVYHRERGWQYLMKLGEHLERAERDAQER